MKDIDCHLLNFSALSLDDLKKADLMKRFDTKFVFHRSLLPAVFEGLSKDYGVLDMNGKRSFHYKTLYYDTDDYFFYRQHHDKRVNRYKVRCRSYVDTDRSFVEVKFKNNKKKTIKNRIPLEGKNIGPTFSGISRTFVRSQFTDSRAPDVDMLKSSIWVGYDRTTFAHSRKKERVTFDMGLWYKDEKKTCPLDHLVIAELKSETLLGQSDLFNYLKSLNILPSKFSKYCMGVVFLGKSGKYNRFKKNVLMLEKLS